MALTFVSSWGSYAQETGSISVIVPSGAVAGDAIIVTTGAFNASHSPRTMTGWTKLAGPTSQWQLTVWYRVLTAADITAGFWFFDGVNGTNTANEVIAMAFAYRGLTQAPVAAVVGDGTAPPVVGKGSAILGVRYGSGDFNYTSGTAPEEAGSIFRIGVGPAGQRAGAAEWNPSNDKTAGPDFGGATGDPDDYATIVLTSNLAPNAPSLTGPTSGATLDRANVNRFSWTFSDPNAGDTQSKFDLRYRIVGAGTWTTITGTTPNPFYDAPAATFAAGDYEWQVSTYDSQGLAGPYSASSFFTAASAPATPTITAPVNGATVPATKTVTWSAPSQTAYQLRRVADAAGTADPTTVYFDTGEVTTATDRSRDVTFPTNNRWEHVQVRIKLAGLWSAWASARVSVSYTLPATPTRTLTATANAIVVATANPVPSGGQPTVVANRVYVDDGDGEQLRAEIAPNSSWTYWTPRSGRDYSGAIRVVALGDNGTEASS